MVYCVSSLRLPIEIDAKGLTNERQILPTVGSICFRALIRAPTEFQLQATRYKWTIVMVAKIPRSELPVADSLPLGVIRATLSKLGPQDQLAASVSVSVSVSTGGRVIGTERELGWRPLTEKTTQRWEHISSRVVSIHVFIRTNFNWSKLNGLSESLMYICRQPVAFCWRQRHETRLSIASELFVDATEIENAPTPTR